MSDQNERIPVCVGDVVVEWCRFGSQRFAVLAAAPNVRTIRLRGVIVRFIVSPVQESTDGEHQHSGGDSSLRLTYEEALGGGHHLTVLKRAAPGGAYVRWSDRDQFDPRRFNSDGLKPKSVR